MGIAERRKRLCLLLIIGLLFSGMCVEAVSADSIFPHQISLSLAENCRVFRDIYAEDLFGAANGDTVQEHISGDSNHKAAHWLPVQEVLLNDLISFRNVSEESPFYPPREESTVIGYIHRQDGKKG